MSMRIQPPTKPDNNYRPRLGGNGTGRVGASEASVGRVAGMRRLKGLDTKNPDVTSEFAKRSVVAAAAGLAILSSGFVLTGDSTPKTAESVSGEKIIDGLASSDVGVIISDRVDTFSVSSSGESSQ